MEAAIFGYCYGIFTLVVILSFCTSRGKFDFRVFTTGAWQWHCNRSEVVSLRKGEQAAGSLQPAARRLLQSHLVVYFWPWQFTAIEVHLWLLGLPCIYEAFRTYSWSSETALLFVFGDLYPLGSL